MNSWVGADSKIDGFSCWSNSESEEKYGNSPKKVSYGGKGSYDTFKLMFLYFFLWQLKVLVLVWIVHTLQDTLSSLVVTGLRLRFEGKVV